MSRSGTSHPTGRCLADVGLAGAVLAAVALIAGGCTDPGGPAGARAPGFVIGAKDQRSPSKDPRVARVMNWNNLKAEVCTAWMAPNGVFVTAGHCAVGTSTDGWCSAKTLSKDFVQIEFNVPESLPDGTPRKAAAEDTYQIDRASVVCHFQDYKPGYISRTDWALFRVKGDPVTRQRHKFPNEKMFYRTSRVEVKDIDPDTGTMPVLEVTGYGADGPSPCWGSPVQKTSGCGTDDNPPPRNRYNLIQQTATGRFKGYISSTSPGPYLDILHLVDTEPGTSGAPILLNGTEMTAVGINSAGFRVSDTNKYSFGQSFRLSELRKALQDFQGGELATPIPGDRIFYVDLGGMAASDVATGNLFEPFRKIEDGFALATSNSAPTIVSVVAGIYGGTTDPDKAEPQNITVTPKSTLYFDMPVGNVTLWGTEE